MLVLVVIVALAGVGVSRAADSDRPSSCGVELLDSGSVLVMWSGGGDWVNIVRNDERLVTTSIRDDGPRFIDNRPPGGTTTYGVGVRDFGGPVGETLVCGTVQTQADLPLDSVPRCRVTIKNDYDQGAIEVEWDKVARATEYVVWNNGHQIHTTASARYDVPGRYDGQKTQHFAVLSKDGADIATKTYCGKISPDETAGGVQSVAECSVSVLIDDEVRLDWTAAPGATDYVMWNNGRQTFESDGRIWMAINFGGGVGTNQHFAVSSKTNAGLAPKTYCGMVTPDELSGSRPSCTVYAEQSTERFAVRWTGMGDGDVVIRRSVDGSPWYWRARSDRSLFHDTFRSGDVSYQVAVRQPNGTTSEAINCTERLFGP